MTVRRIWKLVKWLEVCLAWTLMLGAAFTINERATAQTGSQTGQPSTILTTHIQDTIFNADGSAASGTVLVSWPSFSTAGGSSVPAGATSVTIASNGLLSVLLVPNAGSTPMGSYYTVTYHLANGGNTHEYWVVPSQGGGTVAVSAIRSTVLPASVAMQTVSKAYVDSAIVAAALGSPADVIAEPYVLRAGDTMTGPLLLPGDPTAPQQAADMNYVNEQVAAISSGLNQKVSTLPQATQTVIQPTGTELAVNRLNNVEQASQYATTSSNGIANAVTSADCASGCAVVVDPGYAATEHAAPYAWNSQTHVVDQRGGAVFDSFLNPSPPDSPGFNSARAIHVATTQSVPAQIASGGSSSFASVGLAIAEDALAGGSNVFPSYLQATVPYFKTTDSAFSAVGTNYTIGQHILMNESQDCYGVGDCLMGGMFMRASGGFRDLADEASHPFDFNISEDSRVFGGTCASGCSMGSTLVQISPTANGGTQGEGRYLLDKNPARIITTGTLIGGNPSASQPTASFTGTSFPISTLLQAAQAVPTQAQNIQPGTVTLAIATSGVPVGFATNTTALPAGAGVACVSDLQSAQRLPSNFETAAYTVVDASHLRLTLIRPHASGATIAVGGLCGYGLEQTVDTIIGIRQVFPVIGSTSATGLMYAGNQSPLIGVTGAQSAYLNVNLVIASIARSGNVVTVTTAGNLPEDVNGLTMTVQGVTDSSYNGAFAVTTIGPNSLTFASAGANSASAGGNLSLVTGGFVLYPMAEALSVFNMTSKAVDGQMTLAANTVPWVAGDAVEMPHYFQEQIYPDVEGITQYTPRPARMQTAGLEYLGVLGPGVSGWLITNNVAAGNYFGNGGTHSAPDVGMGVVGVWNRAIDIQAGESAAIAVHCNSHGCGKWNSAYDLFAMDTSVGQDHVNYSPQTSNLTFNLRGTSYQFTPQGLTLGTLNVATINATTLNAGTINGGAAGSGSVSLASIATAINNQANNDVLLSLPRTTQAAAGGDNNTALGVGAGSAITNAREMTVLGAQACTAFASSAGWTAGNPENGLATCIGSQAGLAVNTGIDFTLVGQKALVSATSIDSSIAVGVHAGAAILSSSHDTIIGTLSGQSAGPQTEVWLDNVLVGNGIANGSGNETDNVLVGAGFAGILGGASNNTGVGAFGGAAMTTASGNALFGFSVAPGLVAGFGNTILGPSAGPSGDTNNITVIGTGAASGVTSAVATTLVGFSTMSSGGTAFLTTLVGDTVASQGGTAALNSVTVVGAQAGLHLGVNNATGLFGAKAGISLTTGSNNNFFGNYAGAFCATCSLNTAMGDYAGGGMNGGESGNEAFGSNATTAAGVNNAAQIGNGTNSVSGSLKFNSTTILDGQQNLHAGVTAPAQGSACTAGAIVVNSGFIYVCVAANTWQRAALNAY